MVNCQTITLNNQLATPSGIELTDLQHLLGHEDPATILR